LTSTLKKDAEIVSETFDYNVILAWISPRVDFIGEETFSSNAKHPDLFR
jgi:hypothetical protein